MSNPDPPDNLERLRTWIQEQGYWLEHATQNVLVRNGYQASLGRVYREAESGKLRDIDVLGDPLLTFAKLRIRIAFECKAGKAGAWLIRQTRLRPADVSPAPVATSRAAEFFAAHADIVRHAFPVQEPSGFDARVVGNDQLAFSALRKAVSAARGACSLAEGSAIAYPVVVIAAPLYGLAYEESDQEKLTPLPWWRVVFSGADEPVLVDVVHYEALRDYLVALRSQFVLLVEGMNQRGWPPDQ